MEHEGFEEITFEEADTFRKAWGMYDLTDDDLADIWLSALTIDEGEE